MMEELKRHLQRLGACDLADGIDSIGSAVRLLSTPQGREFAVKTGFPDLATWRANASEVNRLDNVFLDRPYVEVMDNDCIAVGDTNAEVSLWGTKRLYHIIAMHGATVTVKAGYYAVVTVTEIGGKVRVINDGTAKVTIER